jgi:hypothetical protein
VDAKSPKGPKQPAPAAVPAQQNRLPSAQIWQALFQLVIAGAAVVMAFVIFGVGDELSTLGTDMRAAAETSRSMVEVESRAYVGAEIVQHRQDSDGNVAISFNVVNTGQTPAVNARVGYNFVLADEFIPLSDAELLSGAAPTVIPAGAKRLYILDSEENDSADPELLLQNDAVFWFYGVVTYDDVFGQSHVSRFRYEYVRLPLGFFEFMPTNEGNTIS